MLPPSDLSNPTIRIWLACASYCKGGSIDPLQVYGRSFIWNVNRPDVTEIPEPTYAGFPDDGSVDWFCGGHTFLEDGRLLVVNGTNMVVSCGAGGFAGHNEAWILDAVSSQTPMWEQAPSPGHRWYGTVKLFGDGSVGVFGHTLEPAGAQPEFWVQWTPGTSDWTTHFNWSLNCPTPTAHLKIFDYPRMQVLSNGQLMWADSYDEALDHSLSNHESRYLDIESEAWCTEFADHQWKPATMPSTLHRDGGTAHFIVWNGDHGPATFTEIVYEIAGATDGVDGIQCGLPTTAFLATVDKIEKPTATDPQQGQQLPIWDSVSSLLESRANANVVILLDGSILVVGGMAKDGNGNCISRFYAERYKPPKVFGTLTASWVQQNPQSVDRRYHSVAGLLPDGRVFSAGGFMLPLVFGDPYATEGELDAKAQSAHTIEIFSPGYMFSGGRPDIDQSSFNPSGNTYQYGQPFEFKVQLASNATVARVAAIRNGTSTHAYDPDQRYVELEFSNPVSLGNGLWKIPVFAPTDGSHAPPGYYMLTVTDNLNRPSPAEWVVFEP